MNKIWLFFPLIFSFLFFSSCDVYKEESFPFKVWKMENGVCIIEVESVLEGSDSIGFWEKFREIEGYTGQCAFRFAIPGNEYKDPLAPDAPQTQFPYKLRFRIKVENEGEYMVKIHNYHLLKDGDNDAWISINENLYEKIWDHDTCKWSWNEAIAWEKGYQPRYLKKGINTLDITGRSKGWTIDRIAISKTGTPDEKWANLSLQESPTLKPKKRDKIKPETPSNLWVVRNEPGITEIAWNDSKDNYEVLGYQLFVNKKPWKKVFENRVELTNMPFDSSVEINIQAFDYSDNYSGISDNLIFTSSGKDFSKLIQIEKVMAILKIDGLEDSIWYNCQKHKLSNIQHNCAEYFKTESASYTKVLHSDSCIYFLVSVNDKEIQNSGNRVYENDGIVIYLDPDNSKEDFLSINDRIYDIPIGTASVQERINRNKSIAGVEKAYSLSPEGYRLEVKIPFSVLGINELYSALLGVEIVILDRDLPEPQLNCFYSWGQIDKPFRIHPNHFKTCILN